MRAAGRSVAAAGVAVLVAAGPASRPTSQPAGPRAEFVSGYGFRLKYPAAWVVPDHPVNDQLFSARTPALPTTRPTTRPAGERFATVGLRVAGGPDDQNDADVLKFVSGSLVTYVVNHGGTHVTIKPDATCGYPARRVQFQTPGQNGAEPTTVMTVVIVHRHTAYVFAFAAPADAFDGLKPDFEAIAKSFELDN